jgi:hypothetical protein
LRRPSLRSQLNQIRLWVRQGRTDAWIAHKLDISVEQLRTFKRDQGLDGEPEPTSPPPLEHIDVDEVELDGGAQEEEEEVEEEAEEAEPEPAAEHLPEVRPEREDDEFLYEAETERDTEAEDEGPPARRRRRGRRGGRRRTSKRTGSFEATFDHGDEGYGLWLDPAVADNDVYSEHWAGHRAVSVTVEPDAITIRRVDQAGGKEADAG